MIKEINESLYIYIIYRMTTNDIYILLYPMRNSKIKGHQELMHYLSQSLFRCNIHLRKAVHIIEVPEIVPCIATWSHSLTYLQHLHHHRWCNYCGWSRHTGPSSRHDSQLLRFSNDLAEKWYFAWHCAAIYSCPQESMTPWSQNLSLISKPFVEIEAAREL